MDRMTLVQRGTRVALNLDETVMVEFPTTGLDITDHEYAVARISEFLVTAGELAEGQTAEARFAVSYQGMVTYEEVFPSPVISAH